MTDAFLTYLSSDIHYSYRHGGQRVLVCFHGYGESERSFRFLDQYLPDEFSMLAIDLPFHGQTTWNERMKFVPEDLKTILEAIIQIHFPPGAELYFLGYSMGGRIALSLLPYFATRLTKIIMAAPDGLKVNFWYWLSTQTYLGNRLFYFTMKKPGWFFVLLKVGNKTRLVNPGVLKFTSYYIDNRTMREELYNRWTVMRRFTPSLRNVKQLIRQYRLKVHLLYGKYDRIILPERGDKFKRGIETFCTLEILNCGHQVLHEKNAVAICNAVQS